MFFEKYLNQIKMKAGMKQPPGIMSRASPVPETPTHKIDTTQEAPIQIEIRPKWGAHETKP